MTTEELEAFELKRKAEARLNPGCCIDLLCTTEKSRFNKSINLFKKSAEKYKSLQQFRKAGDIYEKCAEIKINLKENPLEFYNESISCYENIYSDANVKKIFFRINNYYEKKGEYLEAGKNCENFGNKAENVKKYKDAIFYYEEAIKYYNKDSASENMKNKLQIKLNELNELYGK